MAAGASKFEAKKVEMNKGVMQPGQMAYIRDEFYIDNNLTILEIPRYAWKITKAENGMITCDFQRRGRNAFMTLTIEAKYLKIEQL